MLHHHPMREGPASANHSVVHTYTLVQDKRTAASQPCMLSSLLRLALLGFDPTCLYLVLGNLHPRSLILDLRTNMRLPTLHSPQLDASPWYRVAKVVSRLLVMHTSKAHATETVAVQQRSSSACCHLMRGHNHFRAAT